MDVRFALILTARAQLEALEKLLSAGADDKDALNAAIEAKAAAAIAKVNEEANEKQKKLEEEAREKQKKLVRAVKPAKIHM